MFISLFGLYWGHNLLRKFVSRSSFYQCGKSGAQNNMLRGMGGRKSVKYQPGWKIRIRYVVILKFINIWFYRRLKHSVCPRG